MSHDALLVGVDPGFASVGVATVRLTADTMVLHSLQVLTTKPSNKKLNVYASDDNMRRMAELVDGLQAALLQPGVVAVCAEAMSFARSASASHKVGLGWGVLGTLLHVHKLPLVQRSPQDIKKAVCQRKDASKVDVENALAVRFPQLPLLLDKMPRGAHEHGCDALAAVVASLDSDVVRMARRLGR